MFSFHYSRQLLLLKFWKTQLGFPWQKDFFIFKSFTSVGLSESTKIREDENHCFAVSYLINSCGLSKKSAILASQKVQFQSPKRPDLVLNLLKENGFTTTQISKLVRIHPLILLSDPESTLMPKIEFFRSIGLSSSDLTKTLSSSPFLLGRSLKNHLIPCYDFLQSVLVSDKKVLITVKRSPRAFHYDVTNNMVPNIALLRGLGVPQSTISLLVTNFPDSAFIRHTRFVEAVDEAKGMGFSPFKTVFVLAVQAFLKISGPKLETKLELYKKWGWSKDMAILAFKKFPCCVVFSEEKITKTMDFLVNKMGYPSSGVAINPVLISLSLEKRIIPRCSVVQILQAKGLVKNNLSLASFLLLTERKFVEKFVMRFQDDVPLLLKAYQGKIDLLDVGVKIEKVSGMENL